MVFGSRGFGCRSLGMVHANSPPLLLTGTLIAPALRTRPTIPPSFVHRARRHHVSTQQTFSSARGRPVAFSRCRDEKRISLRLQTLIAAGAGRRNDLELTATRRRHSHVLVETGRGANDSIRSCKLVA
jgi:hypothetical protein